MKVARLTGFNGARAKKTGTPMEQYQRFLDLQLARAKTRLVLYRERLKHARASLGQFPENTALQARLMTCEEMVQAAERDIDELSSQLTNLRRSVSN